MSDDSTDPGAWRAWRTMAARIGITLMLGDRRIDPAELANHGVAQAPPALASRLALLDEACERVGRDSEEISVSVFGATTDAGELSNLFGEGIHRAVLTLDGDERDDVLRQLDAWAPLVEGI